MILLGRSVIERAKSFADALCAVLIFTPHGRDYSHDPNGYTRKPRRL